MELLKNHFEKLILGIALLALMATAILLSMKMGKIQVNDTLDTGRRGGPPTLDQTTLDDLANRAKIPPRWNAHDAPMFSSVIRWWEKDKRGYWVLKTGKGPTPVGEICGEIPASWFAEYDLNHKDPGICDKDSDGDGWTNAEEFKYKTIPVDPKSFPQPKDYLVFEKPVQSKFYLRFLGYTHSSTNMNDMSSYGFQINVNDFDFTYFVRMGEQIKSGLRKENYWVDDFKYAMTNKFSKALNAAVPVEISTLTIHRGGEDRKITLPFREVSVDTQLKARLINRLKNERIPDKAVGETFEVRGQTYKVVDIKNDGVLISDSLGQEFLISAPKTGE